MPKCVPFAKRNSTSRERTSVKFADKLKMRRYESSYLPKQTRVLNEAQAKLKHMYEMAMSGSSAPIEDEPCAIIPSPFLRAWKQWLFRPSEVHRPEGIDNTQFLCCHGNLILDPNIATDLENDVAIIRQRDYDVLEEL